jgi:hypothetical protein
MKGITAATCDIEHTELELEAAAREISPARSTHNRHTQLLAFHTHCGVDTWVIQLASNERSLVRIVFQSQAVSPNGGALIGSYLCVLQRNLKSVHYPPEPIVNENNYRL